MPTTDYVRTGVHKVDGNVIVGLNDDWALVFGNDTTFKIVRQPYGGTSQSEAISFSSASAASFSSGLLMNSGTAALPSIAWTSDAGNDSGFFFSGTADLTGVTAGGVNCFGFDGSGGIIPSVDRLAWSSTSLITGTLDTFLSRRGAANLRLGLADAAAPVAQILSVQSVVTSIDTAGPSFTVTSSQGTGQGAGGDVLLQVAYPSAVSGATQNTLGTVLTVKGANRQASGTTAMFLLAPTVNMSGTAGYSALTVNSTETATGSGTKRLLDTQVAGTSKMYVANTGSGHVAAENFYDFGAEATRSTTSAILASEMVNGFINSVPAAGITLTFPTAALMVAGVSGAQVGDTFYTFIENTSGGANTITLAGGAGQTLRGGTSIAQNKSATVASVLTNVTGGSEAYTSYVMVGA